MIQLNEIKGRYDTPWGWVKFTHDTETDKVHVQLSGPSPEKWFNLDKAMETAAHFYQVAPASDLYLQVTIAIHGQYSAWHGMNRVMSSLGLDKFQEKKPPGKVCPICGWSEDHDPDGQHLSAYSECPECGLPV